MGNETNSENSSRTTAGSLSEKLIFIVKDGIEKLCAAAQSTIIDLQNKNDNINFDTTG